MKERKKKLKSLLPFHPLTNSDIIDYYASEPRCNGVYSRDNLPQTINKGAYVINLDEYDDVGTDWIALYVRNNCIYFDSFGVEYIPNEIKTFIGNKDIISNIFRLQAYDSIMCGYFCIAFIDFMLAGKTLLQFTNLFSPYDFNKNNKIVGKMFKRKLYPSPSPGAGREIILWKLFLKFRRNMHLLKNTLKTSNY